MVADFFDQGSFGRTQLRVDTFYIFTNRQAYISISRALCKPVFIFSTAQANIKPLAS